MARTSYSKAYRLGYKQQAVDGVWRAVRQSRARSIPYTARPRAIVQSYVVLVPSE